MTAALHNVTGPQSIGAPMPLPDELLYSVVARRAKYLGLWSPKRLAASVFGSPGALAVPDLPTRLDAIEPWARAAWGMSLDELALRHTSLAYHTYLLGAPAYGRFLDTMRTTGVGMHARLGICASTARGTARFRLCPLCVAVDMGQRGETYWRRAHQLPGVAVCIEHGVALHVTSVRFRSAERHDFVGASPRHLEQGEGAREFSEVELERGRLFARASAALLDQVPQGIGAPLDYRPRLRELGYLRRGDGLERLQADIEAHFGPKLLDAMLKPGPSGERLKWLSELTRAPRRALHPVKHLLLTQALDALGRGPAATTPKAAAAKTWGLYRSAPLRNRAKALAAQGHSVRAVARALGVDWKTAGRMLAPLSEPSGAPASHGRGEVDRLTWERLRSDYPASSKSDLRRRAPALYARLYRADRAWLLAAGPTGLARTVRAQRVNWGPRDACLAESIRSMANVLLRRTPEVRVSRNRVLGELEARATVARFGRHLPQCLDALRDVCESVEDYQLRRIANADKSLSVYDSSESNWRVLRAARINPARFADGGRALLTRAREGIGT